MKALVYSGPRDVRVKNVTDAKIERPTDVFVRITSSNICGSDLHMYEGRTDMEEGKVLGHENLGQAVEVGEAVDRIKGGDWVCLPFNVACGFCKTCEAGLTWAGLTTNPGTAGAALHSSKLVRNATLKIYAGAPHGLAYTHNDQLNVDLLAFLKTEELSR